MLKGVHLGNCIGLTKHLIYFFIQKNKQLLILFNMLFKKDKTNSFVKIFLVLFTKKERSVISCAGINSQIVTFT